MEMLLDDSYFMKQALVEAQKAYEKDEVPVGAVVVIQQKIIARAHNLTEQLHDVTAHAEMQAITSAANYLNGKYLKGCTLYVTLEPCVMCAGALYWSQLERVVFAAADPKRGFVSAGIGLHPKTLYSQGVMETEALDLMQQFFIGKRG
ncbi:MAG: nucleoside deaminase [Flavobacteriaceae bacterium]|nr:nucleoside deaminase [Flavobacteriaceae bacterium]